MPKFGCSKQIFLDSWNECVLSVIIFSLQVVCEDDEDNEPPALVRVEGVEQQQQLTGNLAGSNEC